MSRPPPLKPVPSFKSPNVRLALSDADGLTPRTPHSSRRAANARSTTDVKSPYLLNTSGYELDEVDLLVPEPDQAKARLLNVPVPDTSQLEYGPTSARSPLRSPWSGTGTGGTVTTLLTVLFSIVVIALTGFAVFSPEWLSATSSGRSGETAPVMLHPPLGEPVSLPPIPVSEAPPPLMSPAPAIPNDIEVEMELSDPTPTTPPILEHPTTSTAIELAHPTIAVDFPTSSASSSSTTHTQPNPSVISYENYTSFPLTPHQYAEECWIQFNSAPHKHGSFWGDEASGKHEGEEHEHQHHPSPDVASHISDTDSRYCSTSISYILDGTSVGIGAELAVLAQVVGLARERKRPFFIIDKYWNRGSWSDYFAHMPSHGSDDTNEAGCLPPPPEELVACPRSAKHWVVTFKTAKFHLLHDFSEEFEDPRAQSVQRQRPIYERALSSFESLIRPNARVQAFIDSARAELVPSSSPYLSVHIRQGDAKPRSYRYGQQAIPVQEYVNGVKEALETFVSNPEEDQNPVTVYVGSDSPQALIDFSSSLDGSTTIPVKIVSLMSSSSPTLRELLYPRLEGYSQHEWHFGPLAAAGAESVPMDFDMDYLEGSGRRWTMDEMERATVGMLVDLALISGLWGTEGKEEEGPEAIVCGMQSTICTMAAVGLGFDRAFGPDRGSRWIDIDGRGEVEPVWRAFALAW